jgi:hypothetical protein
VTSDQARQVLVVLGAVLLLVTGCTKPARTRRRAFDRAARPAQVLAGLAEDPQMSRPGDTLVKAVTVLVQTG